LSIERILNMKLWRSRWLHSAAQLLRLNLLNRINVADSQIDLWRGVDFEPLAISNIRDYSDNNKSAEDFPKDSHDHVQSHEDLTKRYSLFDFGSAEFVSTHSSFCCLRFLLTCSSDGLGQPGLPKSVLKTTLTDKPGDRVNGKCWSFVYCAAQRMHWGITATSERTCASTVDRSAPEAPSCNGKTWNVLRFATVETNCSSTAQKSNAYNLSIVSWELTANDIQFAHFDQFQRAIDVTGERIVIWSRLDQLKSIDRFVSIISRHFNNHQLIVSIERQQRSNVSLHTN
jgi:hypothetical protein